MKPLTMTSGQHLDMRFALSHWGSEHGQRAMNEEDALRAALAAAEAKLELQGYEYTKALAEVELALGADIHALEAKLADERRHADSLVAPQACDGSGTVLVPHYTIEGEDAGESWEQCDGCCACAQMRHAARRNAEKEVGNG